MLTLFRLLPCMCSQLLESNSLMESISAGELLPKSNSSISDDAILCRLSSLFPSSYTKRCDDDVQQIFQTALLVLHDKSVVLSLPSPPCMNRKYSGHAGVSNMLSFLEIEELETLDPTDPTKCPTAGQCQFACVASALSKNEFSRLRAPHRPDLDLRRLALHTISHNPHMYQDFLTTAGGRRTRSQSVMGGRGVDINSYLLAMSDPRCDGDAITLQALSDALKITIRVVKPLESQGRDGDVCFHLCNGKDDDIYHRRLLRLLQERMQFVVSDIAASVSDECDTEDDSLSMESSECSMSSNGSAFESCPVKEFLVDERNPHGQDSSKENNMNSKSFLCVSEEIRPRRLARIDSRVKEVQRLVRGRLVWLSHVGPGEAHYRYLRSSAVDKIPDPNKINERKRIQKSLVARISQLRQNNYCSLDDGYVQHIVVESNIGIEPKRKPKPENTDSIFSSVPKKYKMNNELKIPTRRRF